MPKIKIAKLVTVVLLTLLIWVWADLALEESYPVGKAQVAIGRSTDPTLWVNFVNPDGTVANAAVIDAVVLKGPTSKLQQVRAQREQGNLDLRLLLEPQLWEAAKTGEQTIALLDLLERSPKIRQWGLTVESCSPDTLTVRIERLEEKRLPIRCIDQNDVTISGAIVEPDKVAMYVPAEWGIDRPVNVRLTAEQIARAKTGVVRSTPYVELAGQRQEAREEVTIHTQPDPDRLKTYTITNVRAGILITETLLAKYQVKVDNPQDLYGSVEIRATEEAKQAYEDEKNTRYQVVLEIDTESTELQDKELIYNFPQKYLRSGEIESARAPALIHFRLLPRPTGTVGTSSSP
jgi:hypothetical protein